MIGLSVQAAAQGRSIQGEWRDNSPELTNAIVTYTQDGSRISARGSFLLNGFLCEWVGSGSISGNRVTHTVQYTRRPPDEAWRGADGRLELTLSEDGEVLNGTWHNNNGHSGAKRLSRRGGGSAESGVQQGRPIQGEWRDNSKTGEIVQGIDRAGSAISRAADRVKRAVKGEPAAASAPGGAGSPTSGNGVGAAPANPEAAGPNAGPPPPPPDSIPAAAAAPPFQIPGAPDLAGLAESFYVGDAAVATEGMEILMGGESPEVRKRVQSKWAGHFFYPSEATRNDLAAIRPLLVEAVNLKAAIAASSAAFDAAWAEAMSAAAIGSENGARAALALAAQHKVELDAQQSRLVALAHQAKAQGEPADPLTEQKKLRAEYRRHLAAAFITAGAKPALPVAKKVWGYKLIKQEYPARECEFRGKPAFADSGEYLARGTEGSFRDTQKGFGGEPSSYTLKWRVPSVILPETPAEFWIQGQVTGQGAGTLGSIRYSLWTDPNPCKARTYLAGVRIYNGDTSQSGPNYPEDQFRTRFPDLNRVAAELKQKGETRFAVVVRNQHLMAAQVNSHNGVDPDKGTPAGNPLEEMVSTYSLQGDRNIPQFLIVQVVFDNEIEQVASYVYQWSDNCDPETGPVLAPEDTITDKQKRQRVAEIEANIKIIRNTMIADQQELARETDPTRRAAYEFRILHAQSDILAEEDLKNSILTGTLVHTRSPFDDHARSQFVENMRISQQRLEQFQRAHASLQRLAAILPEVEVDGARAFIQRQLTAADMANLNLPKAREIAQALLNKVQGYQQLEQARSEEDAARAGLYLEMAQNIKAAADGGMMACSLRGGALLNAAYQGAAGTLEGGWVDGMTRAAAAFSQPTFLAAQAFQGYKQDGWGGAAQTVAITWLSGKAVQYGLSKAISGGGRLVAPANPRESVDLARWQIARNDGIALVKDFEKTRYEVVRLQIAARRGDSAAAQRLAAAERTLEAKAAAIHENMHAKNFLKYKGDFLSQSAFNKTLGGLHERTQARFHEIMQKEKGWSPTPLKEFRNASSAGSVGLDYDIGLDEAAVKVLSRGGKRASLHAWQQDAQSAWDRAYKEVTGRSAARSWETVTTSAHAEAYKDLAWIGSDRSQISKFWATQAADVTRFKNWHMANDPHLNWMEKLQEISRGTSKDMATKLFPLMHATRPANAASAQAMQQSAQYWKKVDGVLKAFGSGEIDPVTASRKIRELTGGKSIAEVAEDMTGLLESLGKRVGR